MPERICEFGVPGELRDRLVSAVLRGEKTATSSLMVEWQHESEPLPKPGERETVIDSAGRPIAVIEIRSTAVIRLGDADLELALAEGEGFHSVKEWRATHESFWNDHVKPELADTSTWPLDDDTQIVVQYFRVLELLPAAEA